MSTNPARQSPAGPPQKLKYPVNRYSPPRGDFIDQDEMAAKLKTQPSDTMQRKTLAAGTVGSLATITTLTTLIAKNLAALVGVLITKAV
jgi:hypothetical protein